MFVLVFCKEHLSPPTSRFVQGNGRQFKTKQ